VVEVLKMSFSGSAGLYAALSKLQLRGRKASLVDNKSPIAIGMVNARY
jgi:hypothetical protein